MISREEALEALERLYEQLEGGVLDKDDCKTYVNTMNACYDITLAKEYITKAPSEEERLRKQLKAISELLKQTHMSDIDRAKFIAILEEENNDRN